METQQPERGAPARGDRATARAVGVLFIVASVTAIIGGSLVVPVTDAASLAEVAEDRRAVLVGALLEVVLVLAVVGIAVLLFPVLRRCHEGLALGYVAARTLEAVALLAASVTAVVAVAVSDVELGPGRGVDELVAATREWTYVVGSLLLFGVGALILYWLLYAGRLVPVWLSLWGMAGAILVTVRGVLEVGGVDLSGAVQGLMAAPIGINEMVLAVWLIAKGFSPRPGCGRDAAPVSSSVRRGVEQSGSSSGS